jgi:hypothetical protein
VVSLSSLGTKSLSAVLVLRSLLELHLQYCAGRMAARAG